MFNATEQLTTSCLVWMIDRYLWKLLRYSGDCARRTTSGCRVLLHTVVTGKSMFAVGECAFVLLVVVTTLSCIIEPSICLYGWGGLKRTWLSCLPHLYALLCHLCCLQWGSLGKGAPIYQMVKPTTSQWWPSGISLWWWRGSCDECTLPRT